MRAEIAEFLVACDIGLLSRRMIVCREIGVDKESRESTYSATSLVSGLLQKYSLVRFRPRNVIGECLLLDVRAGWY